ncbi:MAG: GNAT family N-acetyltransferase [Dehalococcoidia bacterium]
MDGLRAPTRDEIVADWHAFTGGPPVVGALRMYGPKDVEGVVLERDGRRGLATWSVAGDTAELVSIHVDRPGGGLGVELLRVFEARALAAGARRLVLMTTNDNVDALRFYVREGYRLVRVHVDAMDRVRALKPGVPLEGNGGVPLRDMWELERPL